MKTPKKKAGPVAPGTTLVTTKTNTSNDTRVDTEAQLSRVLTALRIGPATTVQLVREHDILHPPARILQLRKRGFEIATVWVSAETLRGAVHRVGKYVLVGEPMRGTP